MKFIFDISQKTALNIAVENNNYDIVELLLLSEKIDVNIPNKIHKKIFFIQFLLKNLI